jgi:intergrase/recombinase
MNSCNVQPNTETGMDWTEFKKSLDGRYSKRYAHTVFGLARDFQHMLGGSLAELNSFSKAKRRMVLASLIALSKHLGCYEAFKQRMHNFGIKWETRSNYESFLRILKDENRDILEWVKTCVTKLDHTYAAFVKFAFISGLRKSEAITAFNLAIKLNAEGKLNEFYNAELEALEYFKYPKTFFRRSKNVFFSFIPSAFIQELVGCRPVSNSVLKRRLGKQGLTCRMQDLRHHHATFMVKHGLLREEADLLQGRVNRSIFMRHYFSPSIQELAHRVVEAVQRMSDSINV